MARNPPGGHNKVSYSQFCQFGSRKSRNDSNLLDPSGSISLIARDSAQALRDWAGWIPFIAAMRWICIEWSLNGSKTQLTYESYDINRTSGSDTDQLVWPLHESRTLGMDAECRGLNIAGWTKPGEKPFCEDLLWMSKMSHPPCVFCTVQGRQKLSERRWKKHEQKQWSQIGFALTCRNFTFDFEPQVRHIVEVVPPNFHISVVWGRVWWRCCRWLHWTLQRFSFDWSKFCIGLSQFVKALLDCLAYPSNPLSAGSFLNILFFRAAWEVKAQAFSVEEWQGQSWVLSTHLEGSFHGRFRFGGGRTLRLIWHW